MAKLKALEKKLFRSVGDLVSKYGFALHYRQHTFVRYFQGGHASLHLQVATYPDGLVVAADVGIRFDEVEEGLCGSDSVLPEEEKKYTCTLGAELGKLAEGRRREWEVSSERDVDRVAREVLSYFEKAGLPYIERYSDIERAAELLTEDSIISVPWEDARRAVMLTWITGGIDKARATIQRKTAFLKRINDPHLGWFQDFAKSLEEKWTGECD
ncbi:MAG TPA: hypothetical protein EYP04_00310 [Anaerolineae bacterium]|nr:hypothetical protein [Anaerolineae bacterium]HIQ20501.1 hypothetical protein [Planctomycetota bacterium]